jgi:uncharacterized RDD family membrane protein YckC
MAEAEASRSGDGEVAEEDGHPGDRWGMPEQGSGSVASMPRRLAALAVDWVLSLSIARLLFDTDPTTAGYVTLLVFAGQAVVLQTFLGTTVGKRLLGIRMAAVPGARLPWPTAVLLRTVLLCLVVPAVINDRDHRGLHDRLAGTVSTRI